MQRGTVNLVSVRIKSPIRWYKVLSWKSCVLCAAEGSSESEARLVAGVSESSRTKLPYRPEVVRALPAELRAEAGARVRLECQVAAYPPARVQWSRDGQRLEADARHALQLAENGLCCLDVLDVQPADVGEYVLRAENELGAASTRAALLLAPRATAPPARGLLIVRPPPRELVAIDGSEALVELMIAAPPDAPPPHIAWFRDNEPLVGDADFESSFDSGTGRVALRIRQVYADDEGLIRCEIAHPFNPQKLHAATILHVLEAPPSSEPTAPVLQCNSIERSPVHSCVRVVLYS